ncbi:hypothetical protein [Streptomyces sp. NBC_00989]|uniref:hypothetical protein n=1 Tax=Streptomyces sp. NBC_00989 TaxID=2903705 RepID=UPI00386FF7A0
MARADRRRRPDTEFKAKTTTVGSRTSSGWGAYVKGTARIDFVQALGFRNNPKVDAKAGGTASSTKVTSLTSYRTSYRT